MRILFVVNSYFSKGNGLDESARRTVEALRAAGQEVRVLSGKNFEDPNGPQPEYAMDKFHFPLMQPMLDSFGYAYADCTHRFVRLKGGHNWKMWRTCLSHFLQNMP